jgi:UDP-glucuronate 4-epimerase
VTTLITGGAGFIGSRLARALLARGEKIIVIDNFNSYYDPALKRANVAEFSDNPNATVIEGDIRNATLVEQIVVDYGVRRIAHLAAMAGVRSSIEEAPLYLEVNTTASMYLMEAARKHGVEQFVQASTSSVYGETKRLPFVEDDTADRPLAAYPASKRAAEILGHTYYHLFKLPVTCLRFFNVYGPNGRPDMMPMKVIKALLADEPITLFNGGKLSRDWTYIDDIVAGVVAALDIPLGYEVINLGCGSPISMNEFVDIYEELSGKTARRIDAPAPLSEPPITFCDNSRARRLLGFDPKIKVADGLANTWKWYINQPALTGVQP